MHFEIRENLILEMEMFVEVCRYMSYISSGVRQQIECFRDFAGRWRIGKEVVVVIEMDEG